MVNFVKVELKPSSFTMRKVWNGGIRELIKYKYLFLR